MLKNPEKCRKIPTNAEKGQKLPKIPKNAEKFQKFPKNVEKSQKMLKKAKKIFWGFLANSLLFSDANDAKTVSCAHSLFTLVVRIMQKLHTAVSAKGGSGGQKYTYYVL